MMLHKAMDELMQQHLIATSTGATHRIMAIDAAATWRTGSFITTLPQVSRAVQIEEH